MAQNLLQQLLIKYRNNELTAEEKDTLFLLLDDAENEAQFEQLTSDGFAFNPKVDRDIELKKEIFSSILKNRNKSSTVSPMRRMKWVAAACVIAIFGVAGYVWMTTGANNDVVRKGNTIPVKQDVQPGNDKAILQLADGTTILLDSIDNGQLAVQGESSIIKAGGELVYSSTSAKVDSVAVFNTIKTPRGGQYKITLSDGTKVWLNSASSLRYPSGFFAKDRRVELTGEAYFEVAKRVSQPFHVQTDAVDVEVLGTHFNVNAYSDELQVQATLIEGSVRINIDHTARTILKPGEQAQVQRADLNNIHVKKEIDINQVIGWQAGLFKFRNADLSMIARQLSRWYDVDVETEGKLTELKLGGGISKKLQLSDVLTLLEANGAKYRWENGKVKLYSP